MLTDIQKKALDQSIYDYLAIHHPSVASVLASSTDTVTIPAADAPPPPPGPTLLEKKWSSVLRLQKRVLDLESQMKRSGVGMNGAGRTLQAGKMLPAFDQPPKQVRDVDRGRSFIVAAIVAACSWSPNYGLYTVTQYN